MVNRHKDDLAWYGKVPFRVASRLSSGAKSPNMSASYIVSSQVQVKRVTSQKPQAKRKLKTKNTIKNSFNNIAFNVHVVRSTKAQRAHTPSRNNVRSKNTLVLKSILNSHKDRTLMRLLNKSVAKANRSNTPSGCASKVVLKKRLFAEDSVLRNSSCKPARSPQQKCKAFAKHEDPYNSIEVKASKAARGAETKANKQSLKLSNQRMKELKYSWKRSINESVDEFSTATNKSNLPIARASVCDGEISAESRQTVIEHECENSYELIYKTLEQQYR